MAEMKTATNKVINIRLKISFVRKEEMNLLFALIARRISSETGACILPINLNFSLSLGENNFSAPKASAIARVLSGNSVEKWSRKCSQIFDRLSNESNVQQIKMYIGMAAFLILAVILLFYSVRRTRRERAV